MQWGRKEASSKVQRKGTYVGIGLGQGERRAKEPECGENRSRRKFSSRSKKWDRAKRDGLIDMASGVQSLERCAADSPKRNCIRVVLVNQHDT